MISLINGKIVGKNKSRVTVLTAGGVGYEVHVSAPFYLSLPNSGEITLHTYLKVSENGMDLYGFANQEEKDFFELLLSVSGVGPKTALNILALGSIDEIQSAIGRGDVKYLTAVQGIGGKTAERMVLELRSKIKDQRSTNNEVDSGAMSDAIDGLVGLGYTREEAKQAVRSADTKGKTTEQVLREVLRKK